MSKRKVYIVSRSSHDYSDAERFGEIVFLSNGPMNRYSITHMGRVFYEKLKYSGPDDYIVPTGLSIMTSVATSLFTFLHGGRVNYLLFKGGKYEERNQDFNYLVKEGGGDHHRLSNT
jgi:hypothetical protein